jgi:hypothetical protein
VDVVEVSPPYDHAEITAFLGNRVVLEALSGIAWRRRRDAAAADGDAPDDDAGTAAGSTAAPRGVRRPEAPLLEGRTPAAEG